MTKEVGSWVWLPDEQDLFVPGKVTSKTAAEHIFQTEDGEMHKLPAAKTMALEIADPQVLESKIDNLILLNDLNENSILHNLRIRFKTDNIYTNVSSILISVNPFKLLPLYTAEVMDQYRNGARGKPPHVFGVAVDSYTAMMSDRKNQSVVISGESGAGKSEATKLILQFIADVSSRRGGGSMAAPGAGTLQQQILQANPILEALGNAKTVRNNNSSRFGKLISVKFDTAGAIVGGNIIDYLLEKSRVTYQSKGERNYHAFYQLLAGCSGNVQLKKDLAVTDAVDYHYLDQSGVIDIPGMSDEKEYDIMTRSMSTLEYDDGERLWTWKILAAVLHLSNIRFDAQAKAMEEDSAKVGNPATLEVAAALLAIDPKNLTKALTSREIGSRSVILVSYKAHEAVAARDAVCKAIYGSLFKWTIGKINRSLDTPTTHATITSVLDIFGFESFERNSFEQLCINFCNEKLQYFFNEHMFSLEQSIYEAEGVSVPKSDFEDNQPTLELLEKKTSGMLSQLDEEINVLKGSDAGFLSKILKQHEAHGSFVKASSKNCAAKELISVSFGIKHYAGVVIYNATNFLEKNRDMLHEDVAKTIKSAAEPFVADLLSAGGDGDDDDGAAFKPKPKPKRAAAGPPGGGSAKKKKGAATLGAQFKKQLNDLMVTLNATEPHFVRCMKPNMEKVGDLFDSEMVLSQMRYSGLLEVCRIRKLGYPHRRDYDEFHKRFRCIVPGSKDGPALLGQLEASGLLEAGLWAKGTTRVFMRNAQSVKVEIARDEALAEVTLKVVKVSRGFLTRLKYEAMKKILANLKVAIKTRDEATIVTAVDMCGELPYSHGARYMPLLHEAKTLLVRIQEERRVLKLLESAMDQRDKSALLSAIAAAKAIMVPASDDDDCPRAVAKAMELIAWIDKEAKVKAELKAALQTRNRRDLEAKLREAEGLDLEGDEVKQARALVTRSHEEEGAIAALKGAIKGRSAETLSTFLSKCSELGLDEAQFPVISEAKKLNERLQVEWSCKVALKNAVAARSMDDLTAGLSKAKSLGLAASTPEVVKAEATKKQLDAEGACKEELVKALELRELGAVERVLKKVVDLKMDERDEYKGLLPNVDLVQLKKEKDVKARLTAATTKKDEAALSAALTEAGKMGMTGADVDAAHEAYSALNSANAVSLALASAATLDAKEEVEAAIKAGLEAGLLEAAPEMAAARDRLAYLGEGGGMLEELKTATAVAADSKMMMSSEALAAVVNKAINKPGFAAKNGKELNEAKRRLAAVEATERLQRAMAGARANQDSVLLEVAIQAAEARGVSVLDANALMDQLKKADLILEAVGKALASKDDTKALRAAYDQGTTLGLGHDDDRMRQARVILDRDHSVKETMETFEASTSTRSGEAKVRPIDFQRELNAAIEMGLQLNLSGPVVDAATKLRDEVDMYVSKLVELNARCRTLEVQAQSPSGITPADVEPVEAAIKLCAAAGLDAKAFATQSKRADQLRKQIVVQMDLAAALKAKDRKALKTALDAAQDLDCSLTVMDQVKGLLKELDSAHRAAQMGGAVNDFDAAAPAAAAPATATSLLLDASEAKAAREQRLARASNPKYSFKNYAGLRSSDSFAKGLLLNKTKVKDGMLKWTKDLIPRSLLELDAAGNRSALQIHKSLLGYMGDKSMAYTATLAQDILHKGLDLTGSSTELRDEIYLQLMKQLSSNPAADSINKGWQVMCMCVSTFPPSIDLENYLLNFLLAQQDKKGAVRNYPRFCLRTLEGMLESGASGFVPVVEEIQAYKKRPPILATIALVDGSVFTEELPVTPDLNCAKVGEICAHFLELSDPRQANFGIFVYDCMHHDDNGSSADPAAGEAYADLERTPRPLKNDEYMGDIVVQKARQKRDFKFVYKRKIFLAADNGPSDDEMYLRLVYLQAEQEAIISGNMPLADEATVVRLAAISLTVAFAEAFPVTEADLAAMDDPPLLDFVPPRWRGKLTTAALAKKMLPHRAALGLTKVAAIGDDIRRETAVAQLIPQLQQQFIDAVSSHEYYGAHCFHTHKDASSDDFDASMPQIVADLPDDITLAFNASGVFLFDSNGMNLIHQFGYADIYRWGGSSSIFSLHIYDQANDTTFELKLSTSQAADMAAILLDYINSIMQSSGPSDHH